MEQSQHNEPNPSTSLFQMNLDAQNSYQLRSAASWAKVLGVSGIITGAIIIILMIITMSQLQGYRYRRGGIDEMFGGSLNATKMGLWIFIITGIIFIVGGIFSYGFGNKINAALRSNDQQGLNNGFTALRNYFALRGITILIVLIFILMLLTRSL